MLSIFLYETDSRSIGEMARGNSFFAFERGWRVFDGGVWRTIRFLAVNGDSRQVALDLKRGVAYIPPRCIPACYACGLLVGATSRPESGRRKFLH